MNNEKNNKIDVNELLNKLKNTTAPQTKRDVDKFVDENLSESQAKAVKELLGDEEKTKAILNSEAAKSLFRKFFGGNNNG